MGFITNFFNKILSKIEFNKSLSRFKNYIYLKEKGMKFLEVITYEDYKENKEFYEYIINNFPNNYSIEKEKFSKLPYLINDHNLNVERLCYKLDSFSFDLIIKNPLLFTDENLADYRKLQNELDNYIIKDTKYKNKQNELKEIINNINLIQIQYKFINVYEQITKLNYNYYYDIDDINKINFKLKPIKENIKALGKQYYSFENIDNIEYLVEQNNEKYVNCNLNNKIFDSINGNSLDKEQRKAILQDEKSNLIIAGAGSGKTLTICGKVKFLIEINKIQPEQILLLSYSKKSCDDLTIKINKINENLRVNTFHKLGLDILTKSNEKKQTIEEQFDAIIEKYFREEIKKDIEMMRKVLLYISLYKNSFNVNQKYDNKGDLYQEIKKNDFKTLKTSLVEMTNDKENKETIKKEYVKSYEELAIANYYFINGIDYIYEFPYCKNVATNEKRQYTPDFYLEKYKIYHEHYGIDKNGRANQYDGEEEKKYLDGIVWKRKIHTLYNTKCIETYSYEFENCTIFEKLEKSLKENGVVFKPLEKIQIIDALNSIYNNKNFKSFINLIKTFLNLYKSKYRDETEFEKLKIKSFTNNFEKTRTILFLDIVKKVYVYYENYIKMENKIDFDDMILKATDCIDNVQGFNYKYIIVDEFQDISFSRMQFLKKLIEKGNSKLFAVGDDWQAIYRFEGCDLDIFLNFEKYFGYSNISYITLTYRNSQELQSIVGDFIKKNPEQISKTIKSNKRLNNPIKIAYYDDDKISSFIEILRNIYREDCVANILVLGRHNKDINDLLCDKFELKNGNLIFKKYDGFKIKYSTVHGSKGLEADYVILINADDSIYGFPNKIEDDKILNLVLSNKSKYEFAEERRLWYVALTRTKTYTYILVNENKPSCFVKEIENDCEVIVNKTDKQKNKISCPYCKTGSLVLQDNKFYRCSNYPYCKYKLQDLKAVNNKKCPECGDFLIYRKGKNNFPFYGCHGYPLCTYTEKYIPKSKIYTK